MHRCLFGIVNTEKRGYITSVSVTINKRVIAIELNHLNDWFIQKRNTVVLLRDAKQRSGCV